MKYNKYTFIKMVIFLFIVIFFLFFIKKFYLLNFKENFSNQFPKVIWICHKDIKTIEKYSEKWKKLNPEYEIKLFDDTLCRKMIEENYPQLYVSIFDYLEDGPIKADFWRLCVLYLHGGVYADSDIEPFVKIDDFVEPSADFVICSTYEKEYSFNPNFIICEKNEHIIKNCIDWYISKYQNNDKYKYWDWSIVQAFNDTLIIPGYDKNDTIYSIKDSQQNNKNIQVLKQINETINTQKDDYVIYHDVKIFNDRHSNYDSINHRYND